MVMRATRSVTDVASDSDCEPAKDTGVLRKGYLMKSAVEKNKNHAKKDANSDNFRFFQSSAVSVKTRYVRGVI
jgi:hypothetical protein